MKLAILRAGATLAFAFSSSVVAADEQMLELATASGCFICHTVAPPAGSSVALAPAYEQVAARYRDDPEALGYLVDRVLKGTAYQDQNWGGAVNMRFMPPNVNVDREDADKLVGWILSLEGAPDSALQRHEGALALAATNGCMICHEMNPLQGVKAIPLAPSFREIAAYYDGKPEAREHLLDSVKNGTVTKPKIWENVNMRFMPPNISLRDEDVATLVDWVMALEHEGVTAHPTEVKPGQN
jgi:cytochrome c